ncbi:MAG: ribosomal L7Ae/L30e/S12e/Gadd45 family protein [Clostridiales bacterium]|nr:ribosomal L7Ae/L30e/S12e/Gadd45 family protein [Clostridiales bacterium]
MDKKLASLLSICMKAGKIVSGEFVCERLLRIGGAKLMLLARDASENTQKKFTRKSLYYQIPIFLYGSKSELSHSVGRSDRAVFAVTDAGLAANVEKWLRENCVSQQTEAGECRK